MRRALAGLTTRGRSFVAAGATAIACAAVLGERDLLRAGVLVLVLPLLCTLAVSRTRYRLACARRLHPPRLPAGHESRVDLRLENVSRLPSGLLMVEDRVPYLLGGRARFVVDRIEAHGSRELGYRIRSDVRGRYRIGPLTVRLADPFGMVELIRSFSLSDTLTVTPTIVALPAGRPSGAWTGGGDSIARSLSTAGEDDVTPREYRQGDDLRRVHWRSTARHGELMVRREEQHYKSSGTLFLDTRRVAHRGDGGSRPSRSGSYRSGAHRPGPSQSGSHPAGSFEPGTFEPDPPEPGTFEQAVSAAASIGVHLARTGISMRYVTDSGERLPAEAPDEAFEGLLLDDLAVARTSGGDSLAAGLAALRGRPGGARDGGLVVAVLGALSAEEARRVAAARRGTGTCVAVLVTGHGPARRAAGAHGSANGDTAPETGPESTAGLLRASGWRVVTIRSAAELPGAWAQAGQAGEDFAGDRA